MIKIFNKKYDLIDDAIKDIYEKLYFPILFKVECHKESITYINIPYELEPRIFFTSSTDRTIKLYDLSNGNYIDSLKQLSFKSTPKPIAIKFFKDNPFIKIKNKENIYYELYKDDLTESINILNNKNRDNIDKKEKTINDNINIIYKDLLEKKIREPHVNYNIAYKEEMIDYSNKLIEYNAKKKLENYEKIQSYEQKLFNKNKSNDWNYKINIELIIKKKNLELSILKNKINKVEEEIKDSENNFQHISIFNKYYKPLYIKNLKEEEIDNVHYEISNKIKNINLGLTKNAIRKKEILDILKFEKKIKGSNSTNKIIYKDHYFNSEENKNKKNERRLNKELFKNLMNKKVIKDYRNNYNNFSSQGIYEKSFDEYKNQFNKRYNELNEPIKILFHKKVLKRSKLLPKIIPKRIEIHNKV